MKKYINYPFYPDDMPIDISFIFEKEKPAGVHGFLGVKGNDFYFEDGTLGRFYGVNINGGACFPDKDYAEKFTKRLAKTGINIVRFHQLDSECNTPNIFSFTKGRHVSNTISLDEKSLDKLDYLIYCLKQEGIYCYLDIFTYRKFKSGDDIENAVGLVDAAKPYNCYNRRMIELQKDLANKIWGHYNPYTKIKYSDDPVFVMAEIVNESDLFSWYLTTEPYLGEFRMLFREWLTENKLEFDTDNCDFKVNEGLVLKFKIKLTEEYYAEMYNYLREIGVKIPITGTNWTKIPALLKCQLGCDFTDSHLYFYDWRWSEYEKKCFNNPLTEVRDTALKDCLEMRVLDKPFFVSEWDMTWPNEYRAESPLLYAAAGSLQGWAGFAIHTYSYNTRLSDMKLLGKEFTSATIGGVAYREGVFSIWNDPAKYGLFYHAALITRRGDVAGAKNEIKVKIDNLGVKPTNLEAAAELSKVGMTFNSDEKAIPADKNIVDLAKGEVLSDTGELYRSWKKRFGTIDTKLTKAVYGFLAENNPIKLNGIEFKSESDFAVIALSSLTDKKIEESDNILMTTVGRAFNTNSKFIGDQMYEYGNGPVKVEIIEAVIKLKNNNPNMVVWAVNAEGFYTGVVPSKYEGGELIFTLGKTMPSVYYLIQSQ